MWKEVTQDTLKNVWHNLWPVTVFDDNIQADFAGFCVSRERRMMSLLLDLAKGIS